VTTLALSRYALTVCAAAAVLAGCGGGGGNATLPIVSADAAPNFAEGYIHSLSGSMSLRAMTVPRYVVRPEHTDHSASWMSPAAKKAKELLYESDWSTNDVYVYRYPSGTLVGKLTGFKQPYGQCVDSLGNVYIANFSGESLVKYAHAGTTPIKTLTTTGSAIGCSVDKSGDVAATNFSANSAAGNIEIFKNGTGTPQTYADNACYYTWPAGYDNKGSLYVEGQNGAISVCELAAKSGSMSTVSINKTIYFPGSVMWDGDYLTITDQQYNDQDQTGIDQVMESGSGLTVLGTTLLTDSCHGNDTDVVQPFIVAKKNTPQNIPAIRWSKSGVIHRAVRRSRRPRRHRPSRTDNP
jgi:hypothetical protein